jgi:DNA polymerase elongation subunit (family B)
MDARRVLKQRGFDTFSIYDPKESLMVKDGLTLYKGLKIKDVSILSFDIESTSLEVNASAHVLLISNTFRVNGEITRKLFSYTDYEDEGEMIIDWCSWVREMNPAIICGHNINTYDLPYLKGVAAKYGVTLDLGRNGSAAKFDSFESKFRKDQTQDLHYHKCKIYGREVVDTLFLAIRHDMVEKKYDSYALKKIIAQEGWEVPGRVFYDADKIRHNYKNPVEWEKIKQYAIFDADDSLKLFDVMATSQFYITQSVPKSFQLVCESASGAQINSMLIRSYLQDGHSIPKASQVESFEGGISFGIPGIYKNVFKVDIQSEYPSIILLHDLYDKVKDPKANFLKMVRYFTAERLKNKRLAKETGDIYYEHLQQEQKVTINSFFGFCGSVGLNFNSPQLGAFITSKGREFIKTALLWASGRNDYGSSDLPDSQSED